MRTVRRNEVPYPPVSTILPPPGSPRQQSLLRTIVACCENESRILAALVFGSLVRDNWEIYSDLDLAVVVRDDVVIDIPSELDRISAALAEHGERTLFTEILACLARIGTDARSPRGDLRCQSQW